MRRFKKRWGAPPFHSLQPRSQNEYIKGAGLIGRGNPNQPPMPQECAHCHQPQPTANPSQSTLTSAPNPEGPGQQPGSVIKRVKARLREIPAGTAARPAYGEEGPAGTGTSKMWWCWTEPGPPMKKSSSWYGAKGQTGGGVHILKCSRPMSPVCFCMSQECDV